MAYTGNPSTNTTDSVRLLVGDISTSTSGEFLANADYTFFIAQTPNIYAAACLAANSLAALHGGQAVTKTVGDLSYTKGDAAYYSALCRRLEAMSALNTSPYAGGISRSDKQTVQADSDRVPPRVFRDIFDDTQAQDPNASVQTAST